MSASDTLSMIFSITGQGLAGSTPRAQQHCAKRTEF
jgi:hypothetical protein